MASNDRPLPIDEHHVRVAKCARERDRFLLHAGLVEIEPDDRLKANALQGRGDIKRIVSRILQRGRVLIGRITDDERDALLGMLSGSRHNAQYQYQG